MKLIIQLVIYILAEKLILLQISNVTVGDCNDSHTLKFDFDYCLFDLEYFNLIMQI